MAVSKTLRFQVFRRDGYTCSYCGGKPPEVRLVVDHVVPRALGGSDDVTNLTTSCADCNIGKSATPLDSAVVEGVSHRNHEYRAALARLAEEATAPDSDVEWFDEVWSGYRNGYGEAVPRPSGWEQSVRTWIRRGLTRTDIDVALRASMDRDYVVSEAVFRYMAGWLWKVLTEREAAAAQIIRRLNEETECTEQ